MNLNTEVLILPLKGFPNLLGQEKQLILCTFLLSNFVEIMFPLACSMNTIISLNYRLGWVIVC